MSEEIAVARGIFVTGTDTEVGKTVISALICARYRHELPLVYWKPVASGSIEGRDVETVAELSGARTSPERYLLRQPVSPHLAARLEGTPVVPGQILDQLEVHAAAGRALVVEGVGGLHVPLTDDGVLLSDLVPRLALPAVVVARSGLGTINHTLLTLEALAARQVPVVGVVLNGPRNPENARAIRDFGEVAILAEVEPIEPLDRRQVEKLARDFDRAGRLRPHLRTCSSRHPVPTSRCSQ